MKRFTLIALHALLCAGLAYAQCAEYYLQIRCRPSPHEAKDMSLSSQSRGAMLEARKTYSFSMMLLGRMDYKIIFCTDRKFYPIHFVISDRETGEVLFDNAEDGHVEMIGFSTDRTTQVTVQVTLLAERAEFDDFGENLACLGVGVLLRRTPKLGF